MFDKLPAAQVMLIAFTWILNLGISFWNARAVGLAWVEAKAAGGWTRFMTWMGAIMAATGFSWCYLLVIVLGGNATHHVNDRTAMLAFELGYVLLVPGLLFSGYAILLDSWAQAFRSGRLVDYGVAVYNTAANLRNTYDVWQSFGSAFGDVFRSFGGGSKKSSSTSDDPDKDDAKLILVVALVAAALLLGVLTTVAIIRSYAGSRAIANPFPASPTRPGRYDWT